MCFEDVAVPRRPLDPLMLFLTDHHKGRKMRSHHWLSAGSCNFFVVMSNGFKQGHTQPLRCIGDVDAHMAVLIKLCCGGVCEILIKMELSEKRSETELN